MIAARQAREAGAAFEVALVAWPPGDSGAATELARIEGLPIVALTSRIGPVASARVDGPVPACACVKPLTVSMLMEAIEAATSSADAQRRIVPPPRPLRLTGLHVLVVEDNALNQIVAQRLLAAEGAEVQIASGGVEAVAAARNAHIPFDVILMDVQMPDIDGYEATRLIRNLPLSRHPPIIAMTANAMVADRDAAMLAGMDDHVGKPFDLDHLVDVILRWCRRSDGSPALLTTLNKQHQACLLDPQKARRSMGGHEDIYLEVASSFVREAPGMLSALSSTGGQSNAASRRRIAHTLRGLAATLGAERLQAATRELEVSLASSDDEPALASRCDAVGTILNDTLAVLREIVASADRAPAPHASSASWDQLMQLLRGWNGQALSLFASIRAREGDSEPLRFAAIGEAIDALDFTEALRLCEASREAARNAEAVTGGDQRRPPTRSVSGPPES